MADTGDVVAVAGAEGGGGGDAGGGGPADDAMGVQSDANTHGAGTRDMVRAAPAVLDAPPTYDTPPSVVVKGNDVASPVDEAAAAVGSEWVEAENDTLDMLQPFRRVAPPGHAVFRIGDIYPTHVGDAVVWLRPACGHTSGAEFCVMRSPAREATVALCDLLHRTDAGMPSTLAIDRWVQRMERSLWQHSVDWVWATDPDVRRALHANARKPLGVLVDVAAQGVAVGAGPDDAYGTAVGEDVDDLSSVHVVDAVLPSLLALKGGYLCALPARHGGRGGYTLRVPRATAEYARYTGAEIDTAVMQDMFCAGMEFAIPSVVHGRVAMAGIEHSWRQYCDSADASKDADTSVRVAVMSCNLFSAMPNRPVLLRVVLSADVAEWSLVTRELYRLVETARVGTETERGRDAVSHTLPSWHDMLCLLYDLRMNFLSRARTVLGRMQRDLANVGLVQGGIDDGRRGAAAGAVAATAADADPPFQWPGVFWAPCAIERGVDAWTLLVYATAASCLVPVTVQSRYDDGPVALVPASAYDASVVCVADDADLMRHRDVWLLVA